MTKNELIRLRRQKDQEFEDSKTKRNIMTILSFAVLYFIVFYIDEKPAGLEMLGTAVVAIFMGGIHFFVNSLIFGQLFQKAENERKALEHLDSQISDAI